MSTTFDVMERIQKYNGISLFLVLNEAGNKLNPDLKEEDKKNTPTIFNNNYSDIPKLVNKAVSCVRDMDPLNELVFLQINYSGHDFLIAPNEDLYVFAALSPDQKN